MTIKKLFVGETDSTFIQFFRYVFVGGVAFIADFATLSLLVEAFGLKKKELVAAAIAFIVGLTINYLISTLWVFKKSTVTNKMAEFTIFALIGVIGLGINELIIWLFQGVLSSHLIFGNLIPDDKYYMLGKLVSTAVVFLWNFAARKIILYRNK